MLPSELLETAEHLLAGHGRLDATRVRRAASTIYYAFFHCLARDCADLLVGKAACRTRNPAWRQAYRSLDHGETKSRCSKKATIAAFDRPIQEFAALFVTLQATRHMADYDPWAKITKTKVRADLVSARQVMASFQTARATDRRAFCAYLLFRDRRA